MKDAYRRLFRQAGAVAIELPALQTEYAGLSAVQHLCAAVEAAASGVHGRAREASRADDKWVAGRD